MSSRGLVLLSNGSATSAWANWEGGRGSLIVIGTLATTTKLQIMGPDGATPVDVTTVAAVGKTDLDLPAGQYRLSLSGGSPAGVYASIGSVIYS